MSMRSTQVYDFNIGPGKNQRLQVSGSYFRIMTSTDVLEVDSEGFGNLYPMSAGQGLRGQDFNVLNLVNRSGVQNVGTILVSDANFVDDRITGEVTIIDGEKFRTLNGGALSGSAISTAVAGQHSYTQLWNPAASGKNVIVKQVEISLSGTGVIPAFLYFTTVAQANLQPTRISNKKSGSATGVAQIRSETLATNVNSTQGYLRSGTVSATGILTYRFQAPIVITPGYGLTVGANVQTVDLLTNFDWFEETA